MMKKYFILLIVLLLMPTFVFASNHIYNMDISAYLNEDGSINITETWDVKGEDGTEWYKVINGITKDDISSFAVTMDGKHLIEKNWDIDETLDEKKGYYGINETDNGVELCFGKYDYKSHKFTVTYTITDVVYTLSDAQALYFNFIDTMSNVDFENFTIEISSFYEFPDTLDVWGYGNKGYAYVENGKIKMSNEENTAMGDQYAVALVKFPLSTFTSNKAYEGVNTFDELKALADEGSYEIDYGNKFSFMDFLTIIGEVLIFFVPVILIGRIAVKKGYGYKDNKKIDKKNTNMFRDIPCNKDIFYADTLIYLNRFNYSETNLMGAIILKWIKEDKIAFINETKGVFNKETSSLDLRKNPTFDTTIENELFKIMYKASGDGILESKELEKYCRRNSDRFLQIFKNRIEDHVDDLKNQGKITDRSSRSECKMKNVLSDEIYNDSQKLYGLKLYLDEFSKIDSKEVMEVKIWDEYLMFAYLFGIASKVAKQLKNLYPTVFENSDFDYNTIIFVNSISTSSLSAARAAAESYSAGGGGFSVGGGGGGSFGGGGGGSR